MTPRLSTSTRWTPFPEEFSEQIGQVFSNTYRERPAQSEFIVEGRIYPDEILLRVGYIETGRLRQINFESSLNYDVKKQNFKERIMLQVDAIGTMFDAYFESKYGEVDIDFPLQWRAYEMDDGPMYLQHSTVNTSLEAEADRLLGLVDKKLVYDNREESEDALDRAAIVDDEQVQDLRKTLREQIKQSRHEKGVLRDLNKEMDNDI